MANMFDFKSIGMRPLYDDFTPPATDAQIAELEEYCGHSLPENYKFILKNYNGGIPEAKYFGVPTEDGILGQWELHQFYSLRGDKKSAVGIWWYIENYGEFMGPNTIPFADDGIEQIFYLKWVNEIPQVWFLAYHDLDEPESYFIKNSFDELLNSLSK